MKTTDISIGENLTRQFIDEEPVDVIMIRRTKTPTSAGGYKWTNPVPQAKQTMRKLRAKAEGARRVTSDGKVIVPSAILVGVLDANIRRFDLVGIDDVTHEVVWVTRRETMGRTIAELVQHASA